MSGPEPIVEIPLSMWYKAKAWHDANEVTLPGTPSGALWDALHAALMPPPRPLTFRQVSDLNAARAARWHPGFPADNEWTGADWSNAMCGEAGEAANVVKKLRRCESGHDGLNDPSYAELVGMLADEVADVYLYLDLLATKYGIDVTSAIVRKFNIVSERQGFPERLP